MTSRVTSDILYHISFLGFGEFNTEHFISFFWLVLLFCQNEVFFKVLLSIELDSIYLGDCLKKLNFKNTPLCTPWQELHSIVIKSSENAENFSWTS